MLHFVMLSETKCKAIFFKDWCDSSLRSKWQDCTFFEWTHEITRNFCI